MHYPTNPIYCCKKRAKIPIEEVKEVLLNKAKSNIPIKIFDNIYK